MRVVDPRKRRDMHRENEAIQFHFNIGVDDANAVANEMVASGWLSEEDRKLASKLIYDRVKEVERERRFTQIKENLKKTEINSNLDSQSQSQPGTSFLESSAKSESSDKYQDLVSLSAQHSDISDNETLERNDHPPKDTLDAIVTTKKSDQEELLRNFEQQLRQQSASRQQNAVLPANSGMPTSNSAQNIASLANEVQRPLHPLPPSVANLRNSDYEASSSGNKQRSASVPPKVEGGNESVSEGEDKPTVKVVDPDDVVDGPRPAAAGPSPVASQQSQSVTSSPSAVRRKQSLTNKSPPMSLSSMSSETASHSKTIISSQAPGITRLDSVEASNGNSGPELTNSSSSKISSTQSGGVGPGHKAVGPRLSQLADKLDSLPKPRSSSITKVSPSSTISTGENSGSAHTHSHKSSASIARTPSDRVKDPTSSTIELVKQSRPTTPNVSMTQVQAVTSTLLSQRTSPVQPEEHHAQVPKETKSKAELAALEQALNKLHSATVPKTSAAKIHEYPKPVQQQQHHKPKHSATVSENVNSVPISQPASDVHVEMGKNEVKHEKNKSIDMESDPPAKRFTVHTVTPEDQHFDDYDGILLNSSISSAQKSQDNTNSPNQRILSPDNHSFQSCMSPPNMMGTISVSSAIYNPLPINSSNIMTSTVNIMPEQYHNAHPVPTPSALPNDYFSSIMASLNDDFRSIIAKYVSTDDKLLEILQRQHQEHALLRDRHTLELQMFCKMKSAEELNCQTAMAASQLVSIINQAVSASAGVNVPPSGTFSRPYPFMNYGMQPNPISTLMPQPGMSTLPVNAMPEMFSRSETSTGFATRAPDQNSVTNLSDMLTKERFSVDESYHQQSLPVNFHFDMSQHPEMVQHHSRPSIPNQQPTCLAQMFAPNPNLPSQSQNYAPVSASQHHQFIDNISKLTLNSNPTKTPVNHSDNNSLAGDSEFPKSHSEVNNTGAVTEIHHEEKKVKKKTRHAKTSLATQLAEALHNV